MIGCVTLFPANPLGVVPPTTSIPNTTTYVCSFNKLTRSYAIYVPSLSQSTKTYMNMHKGDYHGFLSAQPTPSMHSCLFSLLMLILAVQYCQNMHSLLTLTLSVMLALLSVGHTHLSHQITQIDNHNDNHKDQHKHDAHNLQMSKTWVGNDGTWGDGQELTHGSHGWPEARAREGGTVLMPLLILLPSLLHLSFTPMYGLVMWKCLWYVQVPKVCFHEKKGISL